MFSRQNKGNITVLIAVSTVVLLTGCSLPWQQQIAPLVETSQLAKENRVIMKVVTNEGKVYDYPLDYQEGLTALDLFKFAGVPVETKQYDFGVYVQSIGGIKEGDGYFWIYYVNGKPAMQAADKYRLKKGDVIEWRLEKEKVGL